VRRGVQVGVQAKLQASEHTLLQALPDMGSYMSSMRHTALLRGPHYRMVLVGGWVGRTDGARQTHRGEFCKLAQHLRLVVATPPTNEWQNWVSGWWPLLNLSTVYSQGGRPCPLWWRWYRWPTERSETLPIVVPQVPAGVPCPETVTPWSCAAVLLERRCREQGAITVADAREIRDTCKGRWNPSTMLNRYFEHSPPPRGRWVIHPHESWAPSARHPGTVRSLDVP
jgi:hypothetical protein